MLSDEKERFENSHNIGPSLVTQVFHPFPLPLKRPSSNSWLPLKESGIVSEHSSNKIRPGFVARKKLHLWLRWPRRLGAGWEGETGWNKASAALLSSAPLPFPFLPAKSDLSPGLSLPPPLRDGLEGVCVPASSSLPSLVGRGGSWGGGGLLCNCRS